jgi:carboxypeptidase C (cathepsin A)
MNVHTILPIVFFLLIARIHGFADETKKESEKCPIFVEQSRTSHTQPMGQNTVTYEAIAGNLHISADDGDRQTASLFFTAYIKKDEKTQASKRPIAFCFNGGPGSSSIWLHMGLLGPKKAIINDTTYTTPPSTYQNNPYTLLADTDLVFIDPVSTGFSTTVNGANSKQFHGIEEDAESFAQFIRLFLTQFKRWESPRFLVGESYGTIRAVGLAELLHDSYFIDLNGIVLVSMCLDFQAYDFGNGNDLPHILILPSYTATAWYHKRLKAELQNKPLRELLKEVEEFALGEYASALLLGNSLDEKKLATIVEKLALYTGLDSEYLKASRLRIINGAFFKEFLRKNNKIVGRFDSRYVGFDHNPLQEMSNVDPSFDAIVSPFTSAFQQYLYKDLHLEKLDHYRVLNADAVFPWNFSINRIPAGLGYVYMSGKLATAIEKNPSLQIFIANGIYDLATPYFASDYTMSHLNIAPRLLKNVKQYYYEAGHMMYLDPVSHAKMKEDLSLFIKNSASKPL